MLSQIAIETKNKGSYEIKSDLTCANIKEKFLEINMLLTPIERSSFEQFAEVLGPLKQLVDDDKVSEIMVNNHKSIWTESSGRMEKVDIVLDSENLRAGIKYLSSAVGNKEAIPGSSSGIVNAAYEGMRIAAVMYPTAMDGDAICIRKHSKSNFTADDYISKGAFDRAKIAAEKKFTAEQMSASDDLENEKLLQFIEQEIVNRKNFLISGGTNAGKTSLLNMFMKYIPADQRVITIEDTEELKAAVPNRVRLLSNKSQGVTAQLLVELCLRMRPDRIIAGEVRSAEALDFLQALNTGHDGGFASLHAKDAEMTLVRLESLAMRGLPPGIKMSPDAIKRDIADCIDYVIHFKKSSTSHYRYLNEFIQVLGVEKNEYQTKHLFVV